VKAILIPLSGDPIEVEQNGFDDLQRLVGGLIELVGLPNRTDAVAYINEEGKFRFPRNQAATALLAGSLFDGDWIAGPCVLAGADPASGEDKPVPADLLATVRALARTLPA